MDQNNVQRPSLEKPETQLQGNINTCKRRKIRIWASEITSLSKSIKLTTSKKWDLEYTIFGLPNYRTEINNTQ